MITAEHKPNFKLTIAMPYLALTGELWDVYYMCIMRILKKIDRVITALQIVINFNSLKPSDAYICICNLTIIGSNNDLSPGRHQAIIWTNAVILLIGPLGTNFNEILIQICLFSFKEMHLKLSSGHWRPFCLDLNVLMLDDAGSLSTLVVTTAVVVSCLNLLT